MTQLHEFYINAMKPIFPLSHKVNVLKFKHLLFLFSNQKLNIRNKIDKILVRVANREDPNQTASSEAV